MYDLHVMQYLLVGGTVYHLDFFERLTKKGRILKYYNMYKIKAKRGMATRLPNG